MIKKKKIYSMSGRIFFLVLIISAFSFLGATQAKAASTDNVFGWAWSANTGWISFNNVGLKSDNTATENYLNTTNGGIAPGIPADIADNTNGYGTITHGVNYGVHICSSETDAKCSSLKGIRKGRFVGYAWSSNIGWINFNPTLDTTYTKTYPDGSIDNYAKVNLSSPSGGFYPITGWARACAVYLSGCSGQLNPSYYNGGWDGWIKLDSSFQNLTLTQTADPTHGWHEFRKWVWGTSDDASDTNNTEAVIGWGTFNCYDINAGGSFCGISNYKVVTNLSVGTVCTNVTDCPAGDYCCNGVCSSSACCTPVPNTCPGGSVCVNGNCVYPPDAVTPIHGYSLTLPLNWPPDDDNEMTFNYCDGNIFFQWKYKDTYSPESKFVFEISDDVTFPNPLAYYNSESDLPIRTNGAINSQQVNVVLNPGSNQLAYNTTYYWRVMVFDSQNPNPIPSKWIRGLDFTTPKHPYPQVSFDCTPLGKNTVTNCKPMPSSTIVNGSAQFDFNDTSKCYTTGSNIPQSCPPPSWTFGDTHDNTSSIKNPSHIYNSTSNKTYNVTSGVTDGDGYTCSIVNPVNVKNPSKVPLWQEISPFK